MVYRQGSSRKSGLRSVSGQEHSRKPPVKASRFGQNVLSSGHDWVGKKKKVRDFKPLTCDFSGRDDWIRTSGLTVLEPRQGTRRAAPPLPHAAGRRSGRPRGGLPAIGGRPVGHGGEDLCGLRDGRDHDRPRGSRWGAVGGFPAPRGTLPHDVQAVRPHGALHDAGELQGVLLGHIQGDLQQGDEGRLEIDYEVDYLEDSNIEGVFGEERVPGTAWCSFVYLEHIW